MTTTSKIPITPGSGANNVATYSITEDAVTKEIGRQTLVDSTGAEITTLPVSAASLPLPAGAATAAKQPAIGTAGTASADVITVQGKTGMTPLDVSSHAVTNAGTFAVQADNTKVGGTTIDTNSGSKSAGTQRMVLATDQPALTTAGLISTKIDQTTLGTTNNVSVSASTGAGTSALIKDDTAFGDGVTSGIEAVAVRVYNGTNYDRQTGSATRGTDVTIKPSTFDNSLSKSKTVCAASTNATSVKGSAGKVYKYRIFNSDTVGYWVKFYNKATAPTVGSDTPVETCWVPAGGGYIVDSSTGDPYTTGIAFATTLLATDADTTVVTNANKLVVNLHYI